MTAYLKKIEGQALIETAVIIGLLFIFFMGIRFVFNCIDVGVSQHVSIRNRIFGDNALEKAEAEPLSFAQFYEFIKRNITGTEISAEAETIKIPEILLNGKGENGGGMEIKTSMTVFGGCWNKTELVELIRKMRFENSSIEELKPGLREAEETVKRHNSEKYFPDEGEEQ